MKDLQLGLIPETSDTNAVLTLDASQNVRYLDTTSWDKASSDDALSTDVYWMLTAEQLHAKNADPFDLPSYWTIACSRACKVSESPFTCCIENDRQPLITGTDGMKVIEVVEKCYAQVSA